MDVLQVGEYHSNCNVECTPMVTTTVCEDYGGRSWPRTAKKIRRQWGLGATQGNNQAVTCAAAFGCGIKHCMPLGFCGGISVGVSGQGTGIQATVGGDDVYDFSFTQQVTCPPPEVLDDGGGGGGDDCRPDDCESPILLDTGNVGWEFSNLDQGVYFDIDGDEILEGIAWADGRYPDTFLALDRNLNGTIDNGYELFGNYTPQPRAKEWEPNGYAALRVYDQIEAGGNNDGNITADDKIFRLLVLWVDQNRDGESQPNELKRLPDSNVLGIGLDFVERNRFDEHGNHLRYWSSYQTVSGESRPTVDVFFKTGKPKRE